MMQVTSSLFCVLGTLLLASSRGHCHDHKHRPEPVAQTRDYINKFETCMQPCGLPLIKLGPTNNEYYFHTSSKNFFGELLGIFVEKLDPFEQFLNLEPLPLPEKNLVNNQMSKKPSVSQYYFHTSSKMTWMEAVKYCEVNALSLVSIETPEENELLMRVISGSGELFWTSGNDIEEEGQYKWMSTGRNISFARWTNWQPSGGNENCLCLGELSHFRPGWHDASCTRQYNFICEKY